VMRLYAKTPDGLNIMATTTDDLIRQATLLGWAIGNSALRSYCPKHKIETELE
jgi:hypothetical protein